MKLTTAMLVCAALVGCAEAPRAPLAEIYRDYENQLVKVGEPYATLSGYPYAAYMDFKWGAFLPFEVDKKPTHIHRNGPVRGNMDGLYAPQLTLVKLKVPPGHHDVMVVGGRMNGGKTLLKNVEFKAGVSYVISESQDETGNRMILISAYKPDPKFSKTEKEYYMLERSAVGIAPFGSTK